LNGHELSIYSVAAARFGNAERSARSKSIEHLPRTVNSILFLCGEAMRSAHAEAQRRVA
jgi:hypothetical protein